MEPFCMVWKDGKKFEVVEIHDMLLLKMDEQNVQEQAALYPPRWEFNTEGQNEKKKKKKAEEKKTKWIAHG
ncbi:hypothetical protein M8J75_012634 [Diaphorina citri]|jgi:hypothetical protein|nr:hypothetical protein M8J75_012634 [Diaphorina citri]